MKLYKNKEEYQLWQGSMLDMEQVVYPESVDAIITDPPAVDFLIRKEHLIKENEMVRNQPVMVSTMRQRIQIILVGVMRAVLPDISTVLKQVRKIEMKGAKNWWTVF